MNKILVIGKTGQIGSNLAELANCQALDRNDLDLSAPEKICARLGSFEADIIMNAAAYTAVDQAEGEKELCNKINHLAVREIARFCADNGKLFVHYSTDYVFDGSGSLAFKEDDRAHLQPLNYYGASKLAGENAILNSACRHLILRTSWVYNHSGKNFVNTILRLAAEKEELKIVADQVGSPTYAADIAAVTLQMLEKPKPGIYHLVPRQQISWYQFAEMIITQARSAGLNLKIKKVIPIPTSGYPTPAQRSLNSRLSAQKLENDYGIILPPIAISLKNCLVMMYAA